MKAALGLFLLSALGAAQAEDFFDDDLWGLCFYDDQCLFSCGDALNGGDCLNYQQGHPDAIPIDVPYFRGPNGGCEPTTPVADPMGYCCTSCDETDAEYFCTAYWNNPDGCLQQGYKFFYNRIEAYKAGANQIDSKFCFEVDIEGNRVASGSGDPHFKTWSGEKFDYHGECDLVLVDNPKFADSKGLRVHMRTTRIKYFSYIERIAVQIGNDVLEFANDVENFLINGKPVEEKVKGPSHKTMLGGYVVRRDKNALSIRLHDGGREARRNHTIAKIDLHHRKNGFPAVIIDGGVTDVFSGSLGLLGQWPTGAMTARDGKTVIETDPANAFNFALEWQVRDNEPSIFKENRFPQFPTTCTPPAKIPGGRLGLKRATEEAEAACAHWTEDKEDCIFDVIATRDVLVAEEGHIAHVQV